MTNIPRSALTRWVPRALVPATAIGVAAAAALAVGAGGAAAGADTSTTTTQLASSADTYTNALHAGTVYGTASNLRVGNGPTGTKNAYLRFDIPAADAGRIATAKLVLTRTDHHLPNSSITAWTASPNWTEAGTNAANAPAPGTNLDTESIDKSVSTVSFDVTSAAQTATTTLGVGLSSPLNRGVAIFSSREGAGTAPTLVLTLTQPPPSPPSTPACSVSAKLVSSCQVWFGDTPQAFTHTLFTPAARLAVEEAFTGRKFDILHEYNTNGQLFPSTASIALADQGRMLSENWKPATDMTWAAVAAGRADNRIDAEAAYLKSTFTRPFFLTIYHEPEDNVDSTPGSGHTTADYVAMYRHTIQRLRADGVTNAVTVMNYMGYKRWNDMRAALYPGDDVVDWIAYDPYMYNPGNTTSNDFAALVDGPNTGNFYTWATTNHPSKPLMLGEWGAFTNDLNNNPNGPAQFYATIANQISRFPALKAIDHFTMEPYDVALATATAPTITATGLTAWKQLAQAPIFNPPAGATAQQQNRK